MDKLPDVVVTAGTTWEPIDSVRIWGNVFTGKTGATLAVALLHHANVLLLTSNPAIAAAAPPPGAPGILTIKTFRTAADLAESLHHAVAAGPAAVFMTAAVCDYAPTGVFRIIEKREVEGSRPARYMWLVEDVQAAKVKSDHGEIAVRAVATEKIIDLLRSRWQYGGLIYKFKLEAGMNEEDMLKIARGARAQSGAEVLVANTLEMVDDVRGGAWIIDDQQARRVDRAALAPALANDFCQRITARGGHAPQMSENDTPTGG